MLIQSTIVCYTRLGYIIININPDVQIVITDLFILMQEFITIFPKNFHEIIQEFKDKLHYFLAHQMRKVYLNKKWFNYFKAV
jgi:hypothetical protein